MLKKTNKATARRVWTQSRRELMLKKLLAFFGSNPAQNTDAVVKATPDPAPPPVQARRQDPLSHPSSSAPFFDELMAARANNFDLAMAVAMKVDKWRLQARMGNPYLVHPEYRKYLLMAMLSKDFEEQSYLYTLIQTNIIRNYPTVAAVRDL